VSDAWRDCRRVLARHSRSFHLASCLFPRARRDEVAAVYAWCRACDDAIDLAPPSGQSAALESLRRNLGSVYAGEPQADAVASCFQEVVRRRSIPIEYPLELLEGMSMDVGFVRYARERELLVYCWRVAGVVGLMMCHVMGVSDPSAAPHAAHLGIAMQLTNICRDVLEDLERGRVYLPSEWLSAEVARELALGAQARSGSLPAKARRELTIAARRMLALADRYYASADVGLTHLEPRSALAVRTARLVYAEIGREIERRGFDVLAGRAVVPTRTKLRLMGRALGRFASERRAWVERPLAAPAALLGCDEAVRLA
jgi:phytoene synthase